MAKSIRILTTFRGDPGNTGAAEALFTEGETRDDLDDAYADLLLRKGLAEEVEAKGKNQAQKAPAVQPVSDQ